MSQKAKISSQDILKKIDDMRQMEENLYFDETDQKQIERNRKKENPIENNIEENIETESKLEKNLKRPTKEQLKTWYGHIKELIVDVFVIEARASPQCPICDLWKANEFEQKWIYRLSELLGLNEKDLKINVYKCDWNCVYTSEYQDREGEIRESPLEFDMDGRNYITAFGLGISYYPALIIYVKSDLIKTKGTKKKSTESEDHNDFEEIVIQGIGERVRNRMKFKVGNREYVEDVEMTEVSVLKTLLRFLKYFDESVIRHHDKYSLLLGQYHRITRSRT